MLVGSVDRQGSGVVSLDLCRGPRKPKTGPDPAKPAPNRKPAPTPRSPPREARFSIRRFRMKHWNLTTLREKLIKIRMEVLVPRPRRSL